MLASEVRDGRLSFESLSVNVWTNQAIIRNPQWETRTESKGSKDIRIEEVKMSGFAFGPYLFGGQIEIGELTIIRPEAIFIAAETDSTEVHHEVSPPISIKDILINNIVVIDGALDYFRNDSMELAFSCRFPRMELEDLRIDSSTLGRPLPFDYGDYNVRANSLFYRMSELYNLEVKHATGKNQHLTLDTLTIKSPYDKYAFQSHIAHERSWVDLTIPFTEIEGIRWDINSDTTVFAATKIMLSDGDLYLYKDNRLPDYPFSKPLYSRLVRELPIHLDVDSIEVRDADITFQLQTKQEPPPGNVYFRGINGQIATVTNVGMNKPGFPRTDISADARFMKESNIHLDWTMDISSEVDSFYISGSLSRIGAEGINYFLTPTMNMTTEGAIDRLDFNFAADNAYAGGDMYINYDALRINLLKKDGRERSRWISDVLNFILKNRLDGPVEKKGLRVERNQTKSFWSYLWEMVKGGTLETIT